MKIKNYTWHTVTFVDGKTIEMHGKVRISTTDTNMGSIDGVPVIKKTFHKSEMTLPEKERWVVVLVSKIVCEVHSDRDDLYMITNVMRDPVTRAPLWATWISQNPYYLED